MDNKSARPIVLSCPIVLSWNIVKYVMSSFPFISLEIIENTVVIYFCFYVCVLHGMTVPIIKTIEIRTYYHSNTVDLGLLEGHISLWNYDRPSCQICTHINMHAPIHRNSGSSQIPCCSSTYAQGPGVPLHSSSQFLSKEFSKNHIIHKRASVNLPARLDLQSRRSSHSAHTPIIPKLMQAGWGENWKHHQSGFPISFK